MQDRRATVPGKSSEAPKPPSRTDSPMLVSGRTLSELVKRRDTPMSTVRHSLR